MRSWLKKPKVGNDWDTFGHLTAPTFLQIVSKRVTANKGESAWLETICTIASMRSKKARKKSTALHRISPRSNRLVRLYAMEDHRSTTTSDISTTPPTWGF